MEVKKENRGGKREGAGRKKTSTADVNFNRKVTKEQAIKLDILLKEMRGKQ